MPTTMIWDEMNTFRSIVEQAEVAGSKSEQKREETEDILEDILIMAYIFGVRDASDALGVPIEPNTDLMMGAVYKKVADKDFRQRVSEYVDSGTVEDIQRVAETDATRIYNTAVMDAGKQSGLPGLRKQWETMLDNRVRDTHEYLQSMKVGLDEDFYTFDGDHAPYPGGFEMAENNCGCRCFITLIRG